MTEEKINPVSRGVGKRGNNLQHQQLTGLFEVSMEEEDRSSSGIPELDRVLGGGIVKGSLTLVGGDPGIGKSTLLLQICRYQANSGKKVVYVSGEESLKQIKMRAQRLGGFDAYGPIMLGLNAPINDLSRGCNASEVYSMAIVTAALA